MDYQYLIGNIHPCVEECISKFGHVDFACLTDGDLLVV